MLGTFTLNVVTDSVGLKSLMFVASFFLLHFLCYSFIRFYSLLLFPPLFLSSLILFEHYIWAHFISLLAHWFYLKKIIVHPEVWVKYFFKLSPPSNNTILHYAKCRFLITEYSQSLLPILYDIYFTYPYTIITQLLLLSLKTVIS